MAPTLAAGSRSGMMAVPRAQAAGHPARSAGRPEGFFSPATSSLAGHGRYTRRMARRISPTFLLVVGLACLTIAGILGALQATVTDRDRILSESDQLAKSEPVREEFSWKIAEALVPHDANSNPLEINRSNQIARTAVESAEFQQAFVAALPALYTRLVDGQGGDIDLDPLLVDQAILKAGGTPPSGYVLRVHATDVPNLHRPLELMQRGAIVLGGFGLLLVAAALIWTKHRSRAVMRIGRWLITVGVLTMLMFWVVPQFALLPFGNWPGIVGIVLATGEWLAVPAALMTALGVTILVMGRSGEAETRRRNLEVIPSVSRNPTRASY